MVGSTLLAVVGPSGSGKSSAVRAGLLPALADGVVPGSERWRRAVMRPGERPLAELSRSPRPRGARRRGAKTPRPGSPTRSTGYRPASAWSSSSTSSRRLFVACRDEAEREAFLDALVEGAADPDERLVVVLAIRADFYGRCAEHADLSTLISANQVLVGPMRRDELRRAIELPARRAGLRVEPRLVSALVGDVAGEPGGLPLLSAALLELWQRRDGRTLRHAPTSAPAASRGRLRGSPRTPTSASARPSGAGRGAMLLRLAGDEGTGALVRRRVGARRARGRARRGRRRALAVLTESRLLTVDEGTVEVAHEALLARVAAAARLARGGRRRPAPSPPFDRRLRESGETRNATRPSSTAAPGSPRRSTGPPSTTPS